jgi:hypothetical protein
VLQTLDAPAGNISVWVANIRALQRPAAVALVLAAFLVCVNLAARGEPLPPNLLDSVTQYAQMVTFYLFGDRSYSYLKTGK